MSKPRVIVLSVVVQGLSAGEAAAKFEVSQQSAAAYNSAVKAEPSAARGDPAHYRIRVDTVDRYGKLTLRRAGKLHHLGIGISRAATPVLILVNQATVDVIDPATGELLSTHDINPDRNYWPNNRRSPGRWPGLP